MPQEFNPKRTEREEIKISKKEANGLQAEMTPRIPTIHSEPTLAMQWLMRAKEFVGQYIHKIPPCHCRCDTI
jgi:hypothetical protein